MANRIRHASRPKVRMVTAADAGNAAQDAPRRTPTG